MQLETNFPQLYADFKRGDFVVHHTERKASGVPIDQALEKEYNKPAKGPGGIIGIQRKKESVAKWNLVKHEKCKYTKFLDDLCNAEYQDEYSLHHEFSDTQIKEDERDIQTLKDHIVNKCKMDNPGKLINMITGATFPDEEASGLLNWKEVRMITNFIAKQE